MDKDSKVISALVIEVNDLKAIITNVNKPQENATKNKQYDTKKLKLFVPERRTVNKGESCTHGGATWYWCPHHKCYILFDGMYMPHKACNHDAWKKKKEEQWVKKRKGVTKSTGNSSTKLQLTE